MLSLLFITRIFGIRSTENWLFLNKELRIEYQKKKAGRQNRPAFFFLPRLSFGFTFSIGKVSGLPAIQGHIARNIPDTKKYVREVSAAPPQAHSEIVNFQEQQQESSVISG